MAGTIQGTPRHRTARFLINTAWMWFGVGAMLLSGFLLSPYLVRKLGTEGYGLWVLSFSLVDYCYFLDLGFRSATVKYVAHYWALTDHENVNSVLNTALLYAGCISAPLFILVALASGNIHKFFQISPGLISTFRLLVILISFSWCMGFVFNIFTAGLEGIQRFDLSNKVNVTTIVVRTLGTAILLWLGYGLIGIGVLVVSSQCLGYVLNFLSFRKIFPQLKLSPRYATLTTLKKMGSFGIHTFLLNTSMMVQNQSAPLLIGHFLPAAFVGFFSLPNRLLQYTGNAVGGIGAVVNSNTAELQARGEIAKLHELAIFSNRYALTLFMPLTIVFWFFNDQLFKLWVPSAVEYAAPLLPILATGYVMAVAGQFSSGSLLLGLGRHQRFARGQLAEALANIAALVWAIPRYGILGAAYVVVCCMIMNRGLFVPWVLSRELRTSFTGLMISIYARPTLIAIPVGALALWLRMTILPGVSWLQLFCVGGLVALTYFLAAFFVCLAEPHRLLLQGWAGNQLSALRPSRESI